MKRGISAAVWVIIAIVLFAVGFLGVELYRQYTIQKIQNSPAPGAPTAPR